jgi:ABC-type antimicrobial peptide transport system permease subunit
VRLALGAGPADIVRLVLASAARLVLLGIVIGVAAAFGLAQWTTSQFFGVSAVSPGIYLGAALAIAAAALLATWQPARQAARVDPVVTLRSE